MKGLFVKEALRGVLVTLSGLGGGGGVLVFEACDEAGCAEVGGYVRGLVGGGCGFGDEGYGGEVAEDAV